jgi:hypothetical protein
MDQSAPATGQPTSRRILVVDDEVTIAESVAARLRAEGFTVEVAHDGPGALAAVEASQPDLVVLDVMLPGFDGLEDSRALGSIPRRGNSIAHQHSNWCRASRRPCRCAGDRVDGSCCCAMGCGAARDVASSDRCAATNIDCLARGARSCGGCRVPDAAYHRHENTRVGWLGRVLRGVAAGASLG